MDQKAHLPHEEMSNRLEIALEAQHHAVHHTMAVDPMPGEKIPGRPASLFGRSDQVKLVVASTDVARSNIWRTIKNWWIKRPAGLTFSCHMLILRLEAKQLKYLRASHALAQVPISKAL